MQLLRAQEVCSELSAESGFIGVIVRRAGDFCCSGAERLGKSVAWIALLVSAAFAQNAASMPDNGSAPAAGQAQVQQQVKAEIVTNPFATPWKLDGANAAASVASEGRAVEMALKTAKHISLTPSPEGLESESTAPADPLTLSGIGFTGSDAGLGAGFNVSGASAQDARNSVTANGGAGAMHPGTAWKSINETLLPKADARSLSLVPKKYDVSHIGDRGVGSGMNFYSTEKEITLGKQLSQEVEQQAKLFADPVVNEYVNRIAQNLARNSDAKVPFKVKIIDSDEVNAFALPGGFFYVNVGLLMAAENEAELAGVLAHEIGHVAARHATKTQTKKDIWDLASLPLVMVGGPAGMAVRNLMGIAVPMTFLKFSRDAEREADLLGIEYQYAAGYDPAAMVTFFEKLSAQEKRKHGFMSSAFSTHPMNEDRIERSQKTIENMLPAKEQYLTTTSDFDQVKARLITLTTGKKQEVQMAGVQRPTLRKANGDGGKVNKDDDRPTLKRQ